MRSCSIMNLSDSLDGEAASWLSKEPTEVGNMVSNVLIAVFLKAESRIGREDEVRFKCLLSSAMGNGCSVHRITIH